MWKRFLLVVFALWVGTAVWFRRLFNGPKRPGWPFMFEAGVEIVRRVVRRGGVALAAGQGLGELFVPAPPPSRRVSTELATLAGLPTEVHTPAGYQASAKPTILYLHGGGYVTCSPATHRELARRLAIAADARVYVPNYRKAPAHVFPAALDDALACYSELLRAGVPVSSLFVGGDSAGGGLTLALLSRLREAGAPLPRAALLLSPWVDLECTGETLAKHAEFDYLAPELIAHAAKMYAAEEVLKHPQISPLHMDFSGLPPMIVQTGGAEVFVSENILLVERMRAAGVQVTHEIAENMVHVFQAFVMVSRDGQRAIDSLGRFVREQAGTEPLAVGATVETAEAPALPQPTP